MCSYADQKLVPGRRRLLAPDLARGAMLVFIAVANVPFWFEAHATGHLEIVGADRIWLLFRGLFVDARSYPLFAMLFGFGLSMVAAQHMARSDDDPRAVSDVTAAVGQGSKRPAAVRSAVRVLRRRGWWLIVMGAAHAVIFNGDVVGAYGFTSVLVAGLVVYRRTRTVAVVAVVAAAVAIAFTWVALAATQSDPTLSGTANSAAGGAGLTRWPGPWLGEWLLGVLFVPVGALVGTAVLMGVLLHRSGFHEHLHRYRRHLLVVAAVSHVLSVAGGLYPALAKSGWIRATPGAWAVTLDQVAGLAGAVGWLSLLGWWAAHLGATTRAGQGGPWSHRALVAVGRRSMTAYMAQSVLFGGAYLLFGRTAWYRAAPPTVAAVWALTVYSIIAALCWQLARRDLPGPIDALWRRAVHLGAARRGTD